MKVLLDKVGVEAYLTTSDIHAYNLVKIDDEYYYIDATFLDKDIIDMDEITKNGQHLINPSFTNEYHKTNIIPANIDLDDPNIEKEVTRLIDNALDEYKVKFKNQIYTLSLAGLVSLLSITGLAVSKKQLDAILEQEEEMEWLAERKKRQEQYKNYEEIEDIDQEHMLLESAIEISETSVNSKDIKQMASSVKEKQNSQEIEQLAEETELGGKDD